MWAAALLIHPSFSAGSHPRLRRAWHSPLLAFETLLPGANPRPFRHQRVLLRQCEIMVGRRLGIPPVIACRSLTSPTASILAGTACDLRDTHCRCIYVGAQRAEPMPPAPEALLSPASLALVVARVHGHAFAHVRPMRRLAIVFGTGVVEDMGPRIAPNHLIRTAVRLRVYLGLVLRNTCSGMRC
jgi:hypothetical protein